MLGVKLCAVSLVTVACLPAQRAVAPRIWNDRDLADWATPIVNGVRPGHYSETEYYNAPKAEIVRTYPVYFPGREPAGYWQSLQRKKPEPLVAPGPRTPAEWTAAGKRAFRELDVPAFRTWDATTIGRVRNADELRKSGGDPLPDGTVAGLRWAVTSRGVALTVTECAGCHVAYFPDGSRIDGAPVNVKSNSILDDLVTAGDAVLFPGDSPPMALWRQFRVPWIPGDPNDALKNMRESDLAALFAAIPPPVFARTNGSPYYPTRIPDLNGVRNRKYLDATATHRSRGPEDVMRYGILVGCCDSLDFGEYRFLDRAQRRVAYSFPDEVMYAIGQYLWTLDPPKNPNADLALAARGRKVFEREGCAHCHPSPEYTNNKLTLAAGYRPPKDHPLAADILPVSVGTDPALATKTRKATGLYKVPSLRGVWYRPVLHHDGAIGSLEEWFDRGRLRHDFRPTGFVGQGVESRAIRGHEFGLNLGGEEKAALIAFLRSL